MQRNIDNLTAFAQGTCVGGQRFTLCGLTCTPSCATPTCAIYSTACVPRCECPASLPLWDNETCITQASCAPPPTPLFPPNAPSPPSPSTPPLPPPTPWAIAYTPTNIESGVTADATYQEMLPMWVLVAISFGVLLLVCCWLIIAVCCTRRAAMHKEAALAATPWPYTEGGLLQLRRYPVGFPTGMAADETTEDSDTQSPSTPPRIVTAAPPSSPPIVAMPPSPSRSPTVAALSPGPPPPSLLKAAIGTPPLIWSFRRPTELEPQPTELGPPGARRTSLAHFLSPERRARTVPVPGLPMAPTTRTTQGWPTGLKPTGNLPTGLPGTHIPDLPHDSDRSSGRSSARSSTPRSPISSRTRKARAQSFRV